MCHAGRIVVEAAARGHFIVCAISVAMPRYYQGVVTQGTSKAYFFADFTEITNEDACVWVDDAEDLTVIATATYVCLRRFAKEFAELFQSARGRGSILNIYSGEDSARAGT